MFGSILNQMIFLFAFMVFGYILLKGKFIPENSATVLSKLENILFVPALVMGTFIDKCTPETLKTAWRILVFALALGIILIPISILCIKVCFKEDFVRKIGAYGLAFSNFGYMGNAIILAVFPDIFFEYLVFTLPLWFLAYGWGVPVLLIGNDGGKQGIGARLKAFANPMMIGMLIGMIIGLTGLKLPTAIHSVIDAAGSCMSPIAMLLTGITVAKINLLSLLAKWRIYLLAAIKLVVYPLVYILICLFIPQNSFFTQTVLTCGMCVMAMPTGLSNIIVPAGYGKDTSEAAGMALITHTLSVISIPLMFMLFQTVVL